MKNHVSGFGIYRARLKKEDWESIFKRFKDYELIEILKSDSRANAIRKIECSRGNYNRLIQYFKLPTTPGARRNLLTSSPVSDDELIQWFKDYKGNIHRMAKEKKIERPWVLRHRLRVLGYFSKPGHEKGTPSWSKGKTKETDPRVAKIGEKVSNTRKKLFKEGKLKNWCDGKTKETDSRLAELGKKTSIKLREGYSTGRLKSWSKGQTKETNSSLAELGRKCSITRKRLFKEGKLTTLPARLACMNRNPRKWELTFKSDFESKEIPFEFQHSINNKMLVDFFFPSKNLVLFLDGCYWHGCSLCNSVLSTRQKKQKSVDIWQDAYLEKIGYPVIRVVEHAYMKGKVKTIRDTIEMISSILKS